MFDLFICDFRQSKISKTTQHQLLSVYLCLCIIMSTRIVCPHSAPLLIRQQVRAAYAVSHAPAQWRIQDFP